MSQPAENEQHSDYESARPLPEDLARSLAPNARHMLNHPTRRGILRELHRVPVPRTPDDLLAHLPGASQSAIAYHARVLYELGAVDATPISTDWGQKAGQSFVSAVATDLEYITALAATEQLDDAV